MIIGIHIGLFVLGMSEAGLDPSPFVKEAHEFSTSHPELTPEQRALTRKFNSEKLLEFFDISLSKDPLRAKAHVPAMYSFLLLALESGTSKVDPKGLADRMKSILPKFSEISDESKRFLEIDLVLRWHNDILLSLRRGQTFQWTAADYRKFYEEASTSLQPLFDQVQEEMAHLKDRSRIRAWEQWVLKIKARLIEIDEMGDEKPEKVFQKVESTSKPSSLSCPLTSSKVQ